MAGVEEEAVQALIREYLVKKGMTDVLRNFDQEMPPSASQIRSNSKLVETLNMQKLVALNKKNGTPYQTNLELLVYYFFRDSLAPPEEREELAAAGKPEGRSTTADKPKIEQVPSSLFFFVDFRHRQATAPSPSLQPSASDCCSCHARTPTVATRASPAAPLTLSRLGSGLRRD